MTEIKGPPPMPPLADPLTQDERLFLALHPVMSIRDRAPAMHGKVVDLSAYRLTRKKDS